MGEIRGQEATEDLGGVYFLKQQHLVLPFPVALPVAVVICVVRGSQEHLFPTPSASTTTYLCMIHGK